MIIHPWIITSSPKISDLYKSPRRRPVSRVLRSSSCSPRIIFMFTRNNTIEAILMFIKNHPHVHQESSPCSPKIIIFKFTKNHPHVHQESPSCSPRIFLSRSSLCSPRILKDPIISSSARLSFMWIQKSTALLLTQTPSTLRISNQVIKASFYSPNSEPCHQSAIVQLAHPPAFEACKYSIQ